MQKLLTFFLMLTICSCGEDYSEATLHGEWKVKEWKKDISGDDMSGKMDMKFDLDSVYSIDYGPMQEEGKWWIEGSFLHTIENGQSEKKVKIVSLSTDTMYIQMNRSGRLENVIMFKDKK